ncbi:hypothetical protein RJT34_22583 [Clitoria ternatea]|uniref:NAD(P)H dehydrogenase (quinone) n=1 Tax=Clitoria ternatea TaxID=43366 RepID=A0AAN9IE60_CLITE
MVPEILSDLILEKLKAPPKLDDVPDIRPEQLVEADAFIFGFPSLFGMMPSQLKAFFHATSELWASQALTGIPDGIFGSTGFHGRDQELSALQIETQNFLCKEEINRVLNVGLLCTIGDVMPTSHPMQGILLSSSSYSLLTVTSLFQEKVYSTSSEGNLM